MDFDETNKVLINTMTKEEASAFVMFLASEILRHKEDITQTQLLIKAVCKKFELTSEEIFKERIE